MFVTHFTTSGDNYSHESRYTLDYACRITALNYKNVTKYQKKMNLMIINFPFLPEWKEVCQSCSKGRSLNHLDSIVKQNTVFPWGLCLQFIKLIKRQLQDSVIKLYVLLLYNLFGLMSKKIQINVRQFI